MAIRFACRCGMLLVVPDEQGGLVAPCPLCGRATVARADERLAAAGALAAPSGSPIPVACACGARFGVPARQAGLVAPCPVCARTIRARIPGERARTPRPLETFRLPLATGSDTAASVVLALPHVAGRILPCPMCQTPINASACRCCACGAALPGRVSLPPEGALALPPGAAAGAARLALTCATLGVLLVSPGLSIAGVLVGLAGWRLEPDVGAVRRLGFAVALGAVGLGVAAYVLPIAMWF